MAKSAKTPAGPGDTAGSPGAGSPEAVSPDVESPEAGSPEAEPQTAREAATAPTDDLDETKRKFREALDRKKQAHAKDTAAAGNRGAGKANSAGGPASSRRQFRRKSG